MIQAATQKWKGNKARQGGKDSHLKQKSPKQTDQHTGRSILTRKDVNTEFILAREQITGTNFPSPKSHLKVYLKWGTHKPTTQGANSKGTQLSLTAPPALWTFTQQQYQEHNSMKSAHDNSFIHHRRYSCVTIATLVPTELNSNWNTITCPPFTPWVMPVHYGSCKPWYSSGNRSTSTAADDTCNKRL